jgi:ribosome-associated protein
LPRKNLTSISPARKAASTRKPRTTRQAAEPEPLVPWQIAVNAAGKKKGADIRVLDLRPVTSFADYFIICTGANRRQIQAIADEIERSLQLAGEFANSIEGYSNADWVLMDYGDYVVHIFSETSRNYYDLERLWRDALVVPIGA